jgi:hypothetical protein
MRLPPWTLTRRGPPRCRCVLSVRGCRVCLSDAAARAAPQADALSQELTFLVLHALRGGPCVEAAAALERVRGGVAPRARACADATRAPLRTAALAGSHGARPAAATLLARCTARARRRAADRDAELRRGVWGARGRLLLKARSRRPPASSQLAARHPHVTSHHLRSLLDQLLRLDAARRPLGCAPATVLGAGDASLVPSRRPVPALPRWTRWPHVRAPMPHLQARAPC